ncbi:RNB domain-containing ribonuclease [Holdemanella sp. SCCA2]|nr:RNB domain-containing ribonuclease [Holdemanella sp. SCCA2]
MREKILEIIERENKNLNPIEIVNMLYKNSTVEDYRKVMDELDSLCRDGILRQTSGNAYKKNELITGVLDMHEKGNAHLLVKDGQDIFIAKNNMKGATDNDTVLVDYVNKEKNEGKVVRVLKRSLGRSLAEVVDVDGVYKIVPLDKDLPYEIVVDTDNTDFSLVDGLIVHIDYVKDLSKGKVLAKIDRVIGHKNAPGNDTVITMIASEFGVSVQVPEDAKEEAKKFPKKLDPIEIEKEIKLGRRDLRGDPTTTMDGKDTKDIDDAVHDEICPNANFQSTIDIADVSYYVKMGSAIWKYAESKGNSDYLANKVGPMLPIELSNGICSLNPNEDRYAVSCRLEIDHSGRIVNQDVFLSVIRSKKKMNYDAVQDILEGKETEDTKDYTTVKYTVKENETIDDIAFKNCITPERLLEFNKLEDFKPGNEVNIPISDIIKLMYKVSKVMDSRLAKDGKCDFDSNGEKKQIFDENDKLIDIQPRVQREAEHIIENHMIYANVGFTRFVCGALAQIIPQMVPFVFRIHEKPNPKKIEDFMTMLSVFGVNYPKKINPENVSSRDIRDLLEYLKDSDHYNVFSKKLLRSMQKARYSPENEGHFGLGQEDYCHFTSPIRRMSDLLVHTIFRVFIIEKDYSEENLRFWASYLTEVCDHISECERTSAECEYAVDDYYDAVYMQDKIGKTFEATLDSPMQNSFFAETTDKYIDGKVDFIINEEDAKELETLTDPNEIEQFIAEHVKPFPYEYNDAVYGYTKKGRVVYRYGDKILVSCIGSNPDKREIDFALVRKL